MVYPSEPEFEQVALCFRIQEADTLTKLRSLQAYAEVASSVASFIKKNPEYQKALDIVSIPERIVMFRCASFARICLGEMLK
jgi:hypothetical protein